MTTAAPLTFEEFALLIAEVVGVFPDSLSRETRLQVDLDIDSTMLIELWLRMQTLLGQDVPTDVAWEIKTLGDAYDFYRSCLSGQAPGERGRER